MSTLRAKSMAMLFALAAWAGAVVADSALAAQGGTAGLRLKLQRSLLATPPERKNESPVETSSGSHVRVALKTGLGVDLVSIYREAQSTDPVYAAARASYLAGQEKLPQGRAGLLPVVT